MNKNSANISKPEVIIIAAMTPEHVIGADNRIPWHVSEDLRHFKKTTLDHTIIMGRRTWESLGKALPGRRNIIVSRSLSSAPPDTEVYRDLRSAISAASDSGRIFIVGGGRIYEEALADDLADTMILSMMHFSADGDVYFPDWNPEFWETESEIHFDQFDLKTLKRKV